ncbi:hypothetical protein Efla_000900 [Eimeria flavescens]
MASVASACAPCGVCALGRRFSFAAREIPHTTSSFQTRFLHITPVDRQIIRAARNFKNPNFRDYFVRRSKEKIRELNSSLELKPSEIEALLRKELSDLRRQALIANLYHCPTVEIYK